MSGKHLAIIAGAGLGVFLLMRSMDKADGAIYRTTDTAGESIRLYNKGGFIVDQRGNLWA